MDIRKLFGASLAVSLVLTTLTTLAGPQQGASASVPKSVTAPAAKSFVPSTANQEPGDFVIAGFDSDTVLVSIGFVSPPAGTSFSLPTDSGLTRSFGYSSWSGITDRISFRGSQADANAALAAMTVSTGATTGNVTIRVSATVYDAAYAFNPLTQNFYQFVPSATWKSLTGATTSRPTWDEANSFAVGASYKGQSGYLVTITDAAENNFVKSNISDSNGVAALNVWIGASDSADEGKWKWMGGPENGTLFWEGAAGGTVKTYASWASNEPNDSSNEDYAVTNWNTADGLWNDLGGTNVTSIGGFVVEFGQKDGVFTDSPVASLSYGVASPATGVTAVAGNAQATVSWSAPSGTAPSSYTVTASPQVGGVTQTCSTSTTSCVVSGLTNGTAYTFTVTSTFSDGVTSISAASSAVTPVTVPTAPEITSLTPGDQSLVLAFSAPESDGGTPVTQYEYSLDGSTWTSAGSLTSPISITGLTNGQEYSVQLRALNSEGDGAASTAVVRVAGSPTAPTISATSADASISVTVTAPSSDNGSAITNYAYSLDGGTTWIDRSPASTESPLVISGLTNGTSYSVIVRAINGNGPGAPSTSVSATPSGPLPPSISSVTKVSPTLVSVKWSAPSLPAGSSFSVDSYTVQYRLTGASTWITFGSDRLASLPLRTTVTGLTPESEYEYRVIANYQGGQTAPSAASSALTQDAACELPGARSQIVYLNGSDRTNGQELFLGGNYIELGLSSLGNFGTGSSKPTGFIGTTSRSTIGMSVDYDGFRCGQARSIDFFLPGSPEERYAVGFKVDANDSPSTLGLSKQSGVTGTGQFAINAGVFTTEIIEQNTTIVDQSTPTTLKATVTTQFVRQGTPTTPVMEVEQIISFGVNDQYFTNSVAIKNLTSENWSSVRYMRSFDPDNLVDQGGNFTTNNEVISTFSNGGREVVRAQAADGDFTSSYIPQTYDTRAPILFYSSDPLARASTFGFSNSNPYQSAAWDSPQLGPVNADQAISIAFEKGPLGAGATTRLTYVTSLDQRDFDVVAAEIAQVEQRAEEAAAPVTSPTSPTSPPERRARQNVAPPVSPPSPGTFRIPAPNTNFTQTNPPVVSGPITRPGGNVTTPDNPLATVNGVATPTNTQPIGNTGLRLRTGTLDLGIRVQNETQGRLTQNQTGSPELSVVRNQTTVLSGQGVRPGSIVQVFMTFGPNQSAELARIPVDQNGTFNGEAALQTPGSNSPLPIGRHVLQVVTVDEDGNQTVVDMPINVAQPSPQPEILLENGQPPALVPGQSLATAGGQPVNVNVIPLPENKQAIIDGGDWTMSIVAEGDGSNLTETEDGRVLVEFVRDESANVSGTGFMPFTRADVWLFSEPTLLGTVDIDENGEFNGQVNVDGRVVNVGEHTLQLQGVGEDGYVRAANLGVIVNDADGAAATTEQMSLTWLWWLIALLAVAVVVAVLWWRRQQQQEV